MKLIWYNSDLNIYEKGSVEDFRHSAKGQYEIVYEFKNTSDKIIEKVVNALNSANRDLSFP